MEQDELFGKKTELEQAIARCETAWQREVMREWGRRNPKPGRLGLVDLVPTPCICTRCKTPSLIIPDMSLEPERGYVICPRCSAPKEQGASA